MAPDAAGGDDNAEDNPANITAANTTPVTITVAKITPVRMTW